jgi:hypothetical protein
VFEGEKKTKSKNNVLADLSGKIHEVLGDMTDCYAEPLSSCLTLMESIGPGTVDSAGSVDNSAWRR